MTITRRSLVLSLPAMAASSLLIGCGEGESGPVASLSGEHASAQSLYSSFTSGSFTLSEDVAGSFPSTAQAMLPNDALWQACKNGNEVNVTVSHVATGGYIRTVSLRLIKTSAWVNGTSAKFYAGTPPGGAAGTLDGIITHTEALTSSTYASTRRFYNITSGCIQALVNPEVIYLSFSPTSTEEMVATRVPTASAYSANAAPSTGAIRVKNSDPTRLIVLNLVREDEGAV